MAATLAPALSDPCGPCDPASSPPGWDPREVEFLKTHVLSDDVPGRLEPIRTITQRCLQEMVRQARLAKLGAAFNPARFGLLCGRAQELLLSCGGVSRWWRVFKPLLERQDWTGIEGVLLRDYFSVFGFDPPGGEYLASPPDDAPAPPAVGYEPTISIGDLAVIRRLLTDHRRRSLSGGGDTCHHVTHCLHQMVRLSHLAQRDGSEFRGAQFGLNCGRAQELLCSCGDDAWWPLFGPLIDAKDWLGAEMAARELLTLFELPQPTLEFINSS